MIIDILLGALAMWGLLFLVDYARRKELKLGWWKWLLAFLNIVYGIFVIEMFLGFLREGSTQAALVLGLITALVAVIWAVLMWRFVFNRASNTTQLKRS